MGVVSDLIPDINSILSIRDDLGVALKDVWFITRTWTGVEIGEGTFSEVRVRLLPSPRVVTFKKELKVREGGSAQQGHFELKGISKSSYKQKDLDFTGQAANIEKFYELSGELCRPVAVTEKHVTWSVVLTRVLDQTRR